MIKETVEKNKWQQLFSATERWTAIAKQFGFAAMGFFMARTSLLGGMAPLGAALTAGAPNKYIIVAAIGSVLGYLMPLSDISALRYTAVLLAVFSIRLILNGLKEIGRSAIWAGVTAATVVSAVGMIAMSGQGLFKGVAVSLAEGAIAGAGAYFLRRAGTVRAGLKSNTPEQVAALLISVSLVLTAFINVGFDDISLGRTAIFVLLLLTARYGQIGTACVCSISSAAAVILSSGGSQTAVVICFAGLLAGVFGSVGKFAVVLAPMTVAGVWMLLSRADSQAIALLIEASAAGLIFALIPKTVTAGLVTFIAPETSTPDTKGLRRTLTMRLGLASAALRGVSETVDEVSRCLSLSQNPSFANVLHKTENDACKGCSFHIYCWEKQKSNTVDAVLAMSEALRRGQPISLADTPEEFSERCLRIERFEDALTKHYTDFLSSISAERRVAEMREVMSGQMNGIADMLGELSEEFQTAQKYDIAMAGRVASALKELDISASECSCVVDKYGRMTVEIKLTQEPLLPINRARILERLESTCERDFEPPEINRVGRTYYITATEKAILSIDCSCTQFNQGQNKHCGDTCRYFFDGRGRLVVIVSDGMGSGGRAAVDSAMTAGLAERLIKAGFGYDCTLKLVNTAMLYKSTDESLATLDIACIDLFSGKTELLKAGAAPTLVRRNGRTGKAECKSLPAGILNEVGFDRAVVTLNEGDVLIMMSDGVCTDGTDWICAEIESFKDGGARQLSERIATAARRRRRDGHDDDITVFAAVVEKAI